MSIETTSAPSPSARLFSPTVIAVHTVLFTPLVGGVLGAVNWRRLGERGKARNDLLLGVGATAVLVLVATLWPERWGDAVPRGGGIGLTVAMAMGLYRSHRPAFEAHLARGGGKAAFWPATLAGIVWILVVFGALSVAAIYGPGHADFEAGRDALARHDDAAAEAAFRRALAAAPDDDASRYNLAVAIARQDRLEEALATLHEIRPDSPFSGNARAFEEKLTEPPPRN